MAPLRAIFPISTLSMILCKVQCYLLRFSFFTSMNFFLPFLSIFTERPTTVPSSSRHTPKQVTNLNCRSTHNSLSQDLLNILDWPQKSFGLNQPNDLGVFFFFEIFCRSYEAYMGGYWLIMGLLVLSNQRSMMTCDETHIVLQIPLNTFTVRSHLHSGIEFIFHIKRKQNSGTGLKKVVNAFNRLWNIFQEIYKLI